MFSKLSNKSEIHKILLISLTNIGDVILTFPVIDILKRDFPSAKLSVVIGPKAQTLFRGNPFLDQVHIFDKRQSALKSLAWIGKLRKERFDLVVDLRNTAIPFMIAPRFRTSSRVQKVPKQHMREKHIQRLQSVYTADPASAKSCALFVSATDEEYVNQLVDKEIGGNQKFVIIAPGAADHSKRWSDENFARVCEHLIKDYHFKIVFVGNETDRQIAQQVIKRMEDEAINLCGLTNLAQLAQLFKHCFFTIVNDSAPLHIASYLNIPVLALFGPTDPAHYGPWSTQSSYLRKNQACEACANPKTALEHHCMNAITVDDVLNTLHINLTDTQIQFQK